MGKEKDPRINRWCGTGRLTRDPESKTVGNDKPCFEFNIAVDDGFGERKEVSFFHVTAWDKAAERAQKEGLRKGSLVYVEGKLKQERWEDREGKKQSKTRITAWQVNAWMWPDDDGGPQDMSDTSTEPEGDIPF